MSAEAAWTAACVALVPPLVGAIWLAGWGTAAQRLLGAQFAGAIGAVLLSAMTFALAQPSTIDLALTLGLLGAPAAILFALFIERWL